MTENIFQQPARIEAALDSSVARLPQNDSKKNLFEMVEPLEYATMTWGRPGRGKQTIIICGYSKIAPN
jgi:hypothetical protein